MLSNDLETIAGAIQAALDAPNTDLRDAMKATKRMVEAAACRARQIEAVAEGRSKAISIPIVVNLPPNEQAARHPLHLRKLVREAAAPRAVATQRLHGWAWCRAAMAKMGIAS